MDFSASIRGIGSSAVFLYRLLDVMALHQHGNLVKVFGQHIQLDAHLPASHRHAMSGGRRTFGGCFNTDKSDSCFSVTNASPAISVRPASRNKATCPACLARRHPSAIFWRETPTESASVVT